jgi:hypothetical protein
MAYGPDLSSWSFTPFVDSHEIQETFRNPLYASSEAFRQAVAFKLSISPDNIGGQAHVGNRPNVINVATPGSNTIHELAPEEAARDFSTVATPEDLQRFADLQDGAADHPMALDYKTLQIAPRRQTQQETTPKPPSIFEDAEQIRRYGKTLVQMRQEEKQREAEAYQQEEQRIQSEREERSRQADERERKEQAQW